MRPVNHQLHAAGLTATEAVNPQAAIEQIEQLIRILSVRELADTLKAGYKEISE